MDLGESHAETREAALWRPPEFADIPHSPQDQAKGRVGDAPHEGTLSFMCLTITSSTDMRFDWGVRISGL